MNKIFSSTCWVLAAIMVLGAVISETLRTLAGNMAMTNVGRSGGVAWLDSVPDFYTRQFSTNWLNRLGQKQSRLMSFVDLVETKGDRKKFNRLGEMTAAEIVARKQATPITDADMDARWVYPKKFAIANLLDEFDEKYLGEVVLPTSDYVNRHVQAYNRNFDDQVVAAALGAVKSGVAGDIDVVLPAGQKIAAGGTGMTLDKLLNTLAKLDGADELDGEENTRVFVWSVQERNALLADPKVGSADYNTVRALAAGQINSFMGFQFRLNKRLPVVANARQCVAWIKGSMKATTEKKGSRMVIRDDLSESIQVRTKWTTGAARVYDEGVVQIDCVV